MTIQLKGAGSMFPLGCSMIKDGFNFAVYSHDADFIEICFFDIKHNQIASFKLPAVDNNIWHGSFSGLKAGDYYGYRAHGKWQPAEGFRFNHKKLLLDPYSNRISHSPLINNDYYSYQRLPAIDKFEMNLNDNAKQAPKSVISHKFLHFMGPKPQIPWEKTIIYELHVKAISMLHPSIASSSKGKLSSLKHPALIAYFKKLGVNCLELMPIQAFASEQNLVNQGLSNYWGYNPISFMAIHPDYCEQDPFNELAAVVAELHKNNIEIILDIVFNHSAETDHLGPHYSWRGLDNKSYYLLDKSNHELYLDYAGTGNVFDCTNPMVVNMFIDALEFWASFGIDGFRFDLASLLALDKAHKFDPQHSFFTMLAQNKELQGLKYIAEPWSLHNYELGNFPTGWLEYNDIFRDRIKQAAINTAFDKSKLAHALAGTDSLFSVKTKDNKRPINYLANHDGFSMMDLVSYKYEHHNYSQAIDKEQPVALNINYGFEGINPSSKVEDLRLKHRLYFILTLFCSQGVPMLRSGDELGQSFLGNNNNYNQDNEFTWINWQSLDYNKEFFDICCQAIDWRKNNSNLFKLQNINDKHRQITWHNADASLMTDYNWQYASPMAMQCSFEDNAFYLLLNLSLSEFNFSLPNGSSWELLFSNEKNTMPDNKIYPLGAMVWQKK